MSGTQTNPRCWGSRGSAVLANTNGRPDRPAAVASPISQNLSLVRLVSLKRFSSLTHDSVRWGQDRYVFRPLLRHRSRYVFRALSTLEGVRRLKRTPGRSVRRSDAKQTRGDRSSDAPEPSAGWWWVENAGLSLPQWFEAQAAAATTLVNPITAPRTPRIETKTAI